MVVSVVVLHLSKVTTDCYLFRILTQTAHSRLTVSLGHSIIVMKCNVVAIYTKVSLSPSRRLTVAVAPDVEAAVHQCRGWSVGVNSDADHALNPSVSTPFVRLRRTLPGTSYTLALSLARSLSIENA